MDSTETQVPEEAKMSFPYLTSFCCCMGLEMGAKFVGYAHLLLALAGSMMSALFAASANELKGTVEDAEDHLYSSLYAITISLTGISAVHVLLATALLISLYTNFLVGIRAWVWAMVALYISSIIYIAVSVGLYGASSVGADIFVSFVEGVVFYAFATYSILTVYSYYRMLKNMYDEEIAAPQRGTLLNPMKENP